MRLIDADAFMEWLDMPHFEKQEFNGGEVMSMILKQPTVPLASFQKHGEWKIDEYGEVYCSQCDICVSVGPYEVFHNIKISHKYCPNCGAKMCGDKIDWI